MEHPPGDFFQGLPCAAPLRALCAAGSGRGHCEAPGGSDWFIDPFFVAGVLNLKGIVCATLAGLGFGLAVGPFWSQWRLELACESNFVITSCACGCDGLMFLGFRVPSWVLGCLKNWNQKVISFASTVLYAACRYVPHVLGLYVPHFACI